jgi:hypothetical protein
MSLVCDVLFYVHLPAMTWYVVHRGCQTGVFSSWEACHAQVNGFKGACYRGYKSKDEALAALGSDDNQIEIRRVDGHPNNSVMERCNNFSSGCNYFYFDLYHFPCMN